MIHPGKSPAVWCLLPLSLLLFTSCTGAVRSTNIKNLVATEAEAIQKLSQQLAQGTAKIQAIITLLKEVRGSREKDGFLKQLDAWSLAQLEANFLREVLRGSPPAPDIRRAVLMRLAIIRETHERTEQVLATALAQADQALITSYTGIRNAVDALKDNLQTIKKYTELPHREFVLQSVDTELLGTLAKEIAGANAALTKASQAVRGTQEALALLNQLSASSTLEDAMQLTASVNDTLNRITPATGSQ